MLNELKNGTNFFDIVSLTVNNQDFDSTQKKRESYKLLKLIDYFNNNFRIYTEKQYFITFSEWNQLLTNDVCRDYLTYVLTKDLKIILGEIDVDSIMKHKIPYIITKYNRIEQVLRDAKSKSENGNENGAISLNHYWTAMEDLIEEIAVLFPEKSQAKVKKYVQIVNKTIDIQKSIEARNYGLMINHGGELLGLMLNKKRPLNNSDFEIILKKKYSNNRHRFKELDSVFKNLNTEFNSFKFSHDIGYKNFKEKLKEEQSLKYGREIHNLLCKNQQIINLLIRITNIMEPQNISNSFTDTCKLIQDIDPDFDRIIELIVDLKEKKGVKGRLEKYLDYYLYTKFFNVSKKDSVYLENNTSLVLDRTINTFNFISDVLTVQSSKELSKLITTKAAPVSSYKIKRFSRFSIDINSYPLFYAGFETVTATQKTAPVFGFSCPIGISFSFGTLYRNTKSDHFHKQHTFRNKNGNFHALRGNAFTATISLIDLGAVVAYRIQHGDEKENPLPQSVKIQQFIAPGLYFSYGIRRTPLVIKFGGQFNPQLRKITETNETQKFSDTFRVNLGIAFDIPLFNVWNRTKREVGIFSNL